MAVAKKTSKIWSFYCHLCSISQYKLTIAARVEIPLTLKVIRIRSRTLKWMEMFHMSCKQRIYLNEWIIQKHFVCLSPKEPGSSCPGSVMYVCIFRGAIKKTLESNSMWSTQHYNVLLLCFFQSFHVVFWWIDFISAGVWDCTWSFQFLVCPVFGFARVLQCTYITISVSWWC